MKCNKLATSLKETLAKEKERLAELQREQPSSMNVEQPSSDEHSDDEPKDKMDLENMKVPHGSIRCDICSHIIPKMSATMHSVHCARNFAKCKHCGKGFQKRELEDHINKHHKKITCNCEEIIIGNSAYKKHLKKVVIYEMFCVIIVKILLYLNS
eukprot:UN23394